MYNKHGKIARKNDYSQETKISQFLSDVRYMSHDKMIIYIYYIQLSKQTNKLKEINFFTK